MTAIGRILWLFIRGCANPAEMEINMRFNFVLVFLLATAPAFAHDAKGPNGGRVKDLGPFHAELKHG